MPVRPAEHEEFVVSNFRGVSSDTSSYTARQPGTAQDSRDVYHLKGEIRTRPGNEQTLDFDSPDSTYETAADHFFLTTDATLGCWFDGTIGLAYSTHEAFEIGYATSPKPSTVAAGNKTYGSLSCSIANQYVGGTLTPAVANLHLEPGPGTAKSYFKVDGDDISLWLDIIAVGGGTDSWAMTTGSGQDDIAFAGIYTGTTASTFEVEVVANGTPDTWRFRKDGGAWGGAIGMSTGPTGLSDGVTVSWTATTGHTVNDIWTLTVTPQLTLSGSYAGSSSGACSIVAPVSTNLGGDICLIPDASDDFAYFVAGSVGSTVWIPSTNGIRTAQNGGVGASDTVQYAARACASFGNRIFIGNLTVYDSWNGSVITTAGGTRSVVWSVNGAVNPAVGGDIGHSVDFFGSTAGSFDAVTGDVMWMVPMRDVLYVFTTGGVEMLTVTGNYQSPFRRSIIFSGRQLTMLHKPVVVDGQYMVMSDQDGVKIFDGTTLRPAMSSLNEDWIKTFFGKNISSLVPSHPGKTMYDQARRRTFLLDGTGIASSQTTHVVYEDGMVERHRLYNDGSDSIVGFLPSLDLASTENDLEFSAVAKRQVLAYRRANDDDDVGGTPPSQITWYWMSQDYNFGNDIDNKTVDRFRLVYEVTETTETNNVDVSIYVDGGNTASETLTFDLTGTTVGDIVSSHQTFTPLTARSFRIKIAAGATNGDTRAIITQFSIRSVRRAEGTKN